MKRFLTSLSLIAFLALAPIYSIGSVFSPVGAVVKVGTTPLHLDSKTNCDEGLWGNREMPENKCRCCVLKHALNSDGTLTDKKIGKGNCLTPCKLGPCSPHVVKVLQSQYAQENISSGDSDEEDEDDRRGRTFTVSGFEDINLVQSIIRDAQTVRMLSVSPETEKDSYDLTRKGIKQVLQAFFSEPGPTHRSPKEVDAMEEKIFAGGAQTDQLFGVFEKGRLAYIVKVLKKASELRNLTLLKDYFHQYNLLNKDRPTDLPAIAMPFGAAQYKVRGKTQSIIIMPAAPGASLYDITKKFIAEAYAPHLDRKLSYKDYEEEVTKVQVTFSTLGDRLGRFHAVGMQDKEGHLEKFAVDKKGLTGLSRNVHGDFHSNNVFYGLLEGEPTITFIDPETLVISYEKPRDVASDLRHFYLYLTLHFKDTQNLAQHVQDKEAWHTLFIKPFLEAYIKGYGIFNKDGSLDWQRFLAVMAIVDRSLNSLFGSKEDVLKMIGSIPFGLVEAQKKYLAPMLENIKASIIQKSIKEEGDFSVL